MRHLTLIFTFLFAPVGFADNSNQTAEEFMQSYLDGYEKYLTAGDDADVAWVTEHFSEPAAMVSQSRGLAPMATREVLAPNIKYFLDNVLKTQGVVKLEWEKMQLAKLSDSQILMSGLANALDKAGKTVEQRASIYILTKSKNGWAVSVNLPHSPKSVPTIK